MPRPARASRRALLTGGAVAGGTLLAVSGCGSTVADGAARAADDDPTAPAVDADSDLVERVGGQVTNALTLAVATGASVRSCGRSPDGFRPCIGRTSAS